MSFFFVFVFSWTPLTASSGHNTDERILVMLKWFTCACVIHVSTVFKISVRREDISSEFLDAKFISLWRKALTFIRMQITNTKWKKKVQPEKVPAATVITYLLVLGKYWKMENNAGDLNIKYKYAHHLCPSDRYKYLEFMPWLFTVPLAHRVWNFRMP